MASPLRYVASDLFLDRTRFASEAITDSRVEFRAANVLSMPFENGEFDVVFAFGLLHHIPNLEDALKEISRVMSPNGLFLFRDPCSENPLIWLRFKFQRHSLNESPLSRRRMQGALKAAGLRILFLNRFWLRFPHLPPGPWSTNIGGLAEKVWE